MGSEVRPTGFLVCKWTCIDRPQPQQKAIRLPPDPLPVADPRVDNFPNGNFGFTQYTLVAPIDYGNFTQAAVLMQIALLAKIPTPQFLIDDGALLPVPNLSTLLTFDASADVVIGPDGKPVIGPDGLPVIGPGVGSPRNWLLLFNPSQAPVEIGQGVTVVYGFPTNLVLGGGEGLYWAAAQGAGQVYQGALSAISPVAPIGLWAWQATQQINP